MPRRDAVPDVRLEHRVVAHAGELDAVVRQHVRVVLEMMADLAALRILEQRLQCREHLVAIELLGRAGVVVLQRHVGGDAGLGANDTPTISAFM